MKFLHLPYLAQIEIFRYLGVIESFDLSLCSKRVSRLLKGVFQKKSYKLSVVITSRVLFAIKDIDSQQVFFDAVPEFEYYPQFDGTVRNINGYENSSHWFNSSHSIGANVAIHWNDVFQGAMMMNNELHELFDLSTERVQIRINATKDKYREVIHWVNTLKPEFIEFELEKKEAPFYKYAWAMTNTKPSKTLEISMGFVSLSNEEVKIDNIETVLIENSEWFKPHHLSKIGCSNIELRMVSFTDEEINGILKGIQQNIYPNLKKLIFDLEIKEDLVVLAEGLDVVPTDYGFSFEMITGDTCTVECFDIPEYGDSSLAIEITKKD